MADLAGQNLGNYRLLRLLGQGGFADVYLAEHIHLNTLAAIKVLQTRLLSNDIEGFRNEARIIAHLKHPHIVPILDFGVQNEIPYLVMEYAANGTLRQYYPKGTVLPLTSIVSYVKQVASALQYAHQQKLIHRDIKPENLLLGQNHEVLLSDFGIAVVNQSSRYQSTQGMIGTPSYMAPEQIQGKPHPASDQYALGVVAYEWLTGERPFTGNPMEVFAQHMTTPPPSLRGKAPTISPEVERVVLKALAKDPQQRFSHVQAFAEALEQASTMPTSVGNAQLQSGSLPSILPTVNASQGGMIPAMGTTLPPSFAATSFTPTQLPLQAPPPPYVFAGPGSGNTNVKTPSLLPLATPPFTPTPGDTSSVPVRQKVPFFTSGQGKTNITRFGLLVLAAVVLLAGTIWEISHFLPHTNPVMRVTSNYKVGTTPAGAIGTVFHITGQNFATASAITFLIDGMPMPGSVSTQSDANGNIAYDLMVTKGWTVGDHILSAKDAGGSSTQGGVPITIVPQGQAHTPGPNGAPPDDMSFKIGVAIQLQGASASNGTINEVLNITGHPDPTGGTVCRPYDDGKPHEASLDEGNGTTYLRTLTASCSGTYKGGKLFFVETATSDVLTFSSGMTCIERTPYELQQLVGTFTNSITMSGTFSNNASTADCNNGGGAMQMSASAGTWTASIVT